MSDQDNQDPEKSVGLLQILQSILAALFGVQSNANRERDFNKGRAGDYIGVFAVMVAVLVITVIVVVHWVIGAAAS